MKSETLITNNNRYLFLNVKTIDARLSKKYRVLPYSQQIIKNENKIFDLIRYLGKKKQYNLLKKNYIDEKDKIKKEIMTQKKKEKSIENTNIINIKSFDADKININSPMSIMEGNLISQLINYCKNKKIKKQKLLEYKKKNKFIFKRPNVTQYSTLNTFFTKKNKNKNIIKLSKEIINKNKESSKNSSSFINNESSISKNDNKFSSIFSLFDEECPVDLESQNEFRKTINAICTKKYISKIKRNKKNLSSDNFFGIQNKKIKLEGNKEQKLILKHKKLSKLFFTRLFKEENNLENNLNSINNNLLDIKNTNFLENYNTYNSINSLSARTLRIPNKNKYNNISQNFATFKKNIFEYPEVNKYIYGSSNPISLFKQLKKNISKNKKISKILKK